MSMFNLKEVSEEGNGNGQRYIYPGIYNEVLIVKWVKGESSQKRTPYIGLQLLTKEGKEAGDDAKEFQFYLSEAAIGTSMKKIKHVITKVTTVEKFESKDPSDIDEMVDHLNDISRGEFLRVKFIGEQYINGTGDVKDAARIGLPDFAEAIQEGAEYPVVSDEDSKLKYDKNNEYDLKKIVQEKPTAENDTAPGGVDWMG